MDTQPTQIQTSAGTAFVPAHSHTTAAGGNVPLVNVAGHFSMTSGTPSWVPTESAQTQIAFDGGTNQIWYYDFTHGAWRNTTIPGGIRVDTITSSSSYILDTDYYDALSITALGATLNTLSTSGSPYNFQKLIIRIKDNGTAQTLDWAPVFAEYGTALPTTTVAGKVMTLGFIYDSVAAVWGLVALQQQ